jgi:hypothetical protein
VGWAHDFQSVAATLTLPPGWRLLHASGADSAGPTWVKSWTLLDLFLALLVTIAVARLFGKRAGVLALVALVLSLQEHDAPAWVWLARCWARRWRARCRRGGSSGSRGSTASGRGSRWC